MCYKKLLPFADEGSIYAMTMLAVIDNNLNKKVESEQWIAKAEACLKSDDVSGHLRLSYAYRMGVGNGDYEVRDKRALYHLEKVASMGYTMVQENLALDYARGMNGCPKNMERFDYWIRLAMNAGSERAYYIYVECLLKDKLQVPQEVIETLELLSKESKTAKKLLKNIAAQGNQSMKRID